MSMVIHQEFITIKKFDSIGLQGDQKISKTNSPYFSKNSPKSHQVKKGQNIYNKAHLESPKHLQ